MKRIIYALAFLAAAAAVSSCDMFEYDNYDGPNAQITGRLLDVKTGAKIGVEAAQTSAWDWSTWSMKTTTECGALVVAEQGFIPPTWQGNPEDYELQESDQIWLVRFDGMYTNNIVFAGNYRLSTRLLPCYEPENNLFELKKGKNKMDIGLVPYCRIVDPVISYDAAAKQIVATFYVELGDPSKANTVSNVALCGNTQLFVGCNYQNLSKNDKGAQAKNVKPGDPVTLVIDMTSPSNGDLFKYTQERYFRIAAMATGNGFNGNNIYNFSPIFKMSEDFSTVEEVVWNENEW